MRKRSSFKMTEIIYEEIRTALLQGKVGCEIACQFGCSQGTVQRVRNDLKKSGRNLWYGTEKGGFITASIGS